MDEKLKNRVAVVVGGSKGIGEAIVKRFAKEGAIVIATGTSGKQNALRSDRIFPFSCDLADPEAPQALASYCREKFGKTDILVNNAAVSTGRSKIHETSLEDWTKTIDINLRGVFLGMKAFLPIMLEQKSGVIINMGSTSAFRGTEGIGAYGAAKGGVMQLTRIAALDYAADGIRVNAVCPGTTQTELLESVSMEMREPLLARIPMGRFASTEDVAALAAFLASDDASYISGQGYVLDGGRFAGG